MSSPGRAGSAPPPSSLTPLQPNSGCGTYVSPGIPGSPLTSPNNPVGPGSASQVGFQFLHMTPLHLQVTPKAPPTFLTSPASP